MSRKPRTPRPAIDRIMDRIIRVDSGCWEFTGAIDSKGYGNICFIGPDGTKRYTKTHRVTYQSLVGPIPDGLVLDHLCRNRKCCNPAHLEPVTHRENLRRGVGFVGVKLASDSCPNGHPYTEATIYAGRGRRECRICKSEWRKRAATRRVAS